MEKIVNYTRFECIFSQDDLQNFKITSTDLKSSIESIASQKVSALGNLQSYWTNKMIRLNKEMDEQLGILNGDKTTLETSGEDVNLHSKRVEKMQNYTRNE